MRYFAEHCPFDPKGRRIPAQGATLGKCTPAQSVTVGDGCNARLRTFQDEYRNFLSKSELNMMNDMSGPEDPWFP